MFGKKETKVSHNTNSTTIITDCMEIKGNVKGCGTIHIDGTINGDVDVEQSVVIGEKGVVFGNVKSQKVMVAGVLKGSLICSDLEVMTKGHVSNSIKARSIVSDGTLEADILAEEHIHITENGKVNGPKVQSKTIVVNGAIKGNVVATQLLEIDKSGIVEGNMTVKNIKTQEGGRMLGAMSTYMEITKKAPEAKKEETKEDKK